MSTLFQPGTTCWRIEHATRVSVIVDADNYFDAARRAMVKARHRIMLIGWDFDARIAFGQPDDGGPETIGEFILWLVERTPGLEIYLLRWDMGAIKTLFRPRTLWMVMRWMRHRRIHTRLDSAHPPGASHHQKIVVIDDCFAFCGGIDMTSERWDTREHLDDHPQRLSPGGRRHGPWHDATTAVEGPIAAALGALGCERWANAGGETLAAVTGQSDCWPEGLVPHFEAVDMAVARSSPVHAERPAVAEIEALYVAMIASAKGFIYAENQYFASRRIAEAIARRLEEDDPPEIVIINPLGAQGWLEPYAMDTARARLVEALRRIDRHGRLRIYHAFTAGGTPIYVHAKLTIVDDHVLRIGSANMNNRSMQLDTECDVALDHPAGADTIASIRMGLIAEHLNVDATAVMDAIAAEGGMIGAIERLRHAGHRLRPYVVPDLSSVETWLADNEVLDPEGPDEMFETPARRGLFRRRLQRPRD